MLEMLAERGIKIERNQNLIDMKKRRVNEYMGYSRLLGVVTGPKDVRLG
jgi:hypothetical protein